MPPCIAQINGSLTCGVVGRWRMRLLETTIPGVVFWSGRPLRWPHDCTDHYKAFVRWKREYGIVSVWAQAFPL